MKDFNITGPDSMRWREIYIHWPEDVDSILAGTPLNERGEKANDGTAIGILMDDIRKDKHLRGRVLTAGYMDFDAAEEHSGIKLSVETKKALPKLYRLDGPVDVSRLPEGYPYKEKSVLFEGKDIGFEYLEEDNAAYPSNTIVLFGELVSGKKYAVVWDGVEYSDLVAFDDAWGNVVIGAPYGETNADMPFNIATVNGYPVIDMSTYSDAATHSVSIYGETIHTMSPEFLPAGVDGGVIVKLNASNNTHDADFATMVNALKKGNVVFRDASEDMFRLYIPLEYSIGDSDTAEHVTVANFASDGNITSCFDLYTDGTISQIGGK